MTTVIWSMAAGACLTLGLVHLLVWFWDRARRANLWFAGLAFSIMLVALGEWALMHAASPAAFCGLHRWSHFAVFLAIVCVVGFVQSYFQTGRPGLAWTVVAWRALVVVLGFFPGPTFNYREVTALIPFALFGETVVVPVGSAQPWARFGEASLLLMIAFVVDAALRLWRKGGRRERQRALIVGTGIVLCLVASTANALLVHTGLKPMPYFISLSFLFIAGAMASELSRDMLGAARLAEELRESAETMTLAAGAAQLALWRWDIPRDVIWTSAPGRSLEAAPASEPVNFQHFLATLHPDDRAPVQRAVDAALSNGGKFRASYRVRRPDGATRWMEATGKVEFAEGRALRLLGVSADVTARKAAEAETRQHREELAHLSRVALLGEMAGTLAHELNQPLAGIVNNASAGRRFIAKGRGDLPRLDELFDAINADGRRAGEIIRSIRDMVRKGEPERGPVPLADVVSAALRLVRAETVGRHCEIVVETADALPPVAGDAVQLQQVLLNLIVNAFDAMRDTPEAQRRLILRTARASEESVALSVRDFGTGLPEDVPERVFEQFYSTKREGLGLGLAIARSIITSHGGTLDGANAEGGGACFSIVLPIWKEDGA